MRSLAVATAVLAAVAATGDAATAAQQHRHAAWTPSPVPVFVAGPVPQYRIPAAVITARGTVVAFAEKRYAPASDCGFKTLVARRSTDMGATWGPELLVAGASPTNSTSTGNPQAVFHAASGRIVVTFAVQQLPASAGCSPSDGVFVLDDGGSDGVAWGAPVNITSQLGPLAGHSVPGPGAGLVLRRGAHAGRVLMSASFGAYRMDSVFYSDDGGASWLVSVAGALKGMDESALAELADGTVVINMRNAHLNASCNCRALALSADAGATFGAVTYDPTLISPVCQASLLSVGSSVFFANPADVAQRANTTIRRGSGAPGGWSDTTLLVQPGAAWGGYTSLVGPLDAQAQLGGLLWEHWPAGGQATISWTSFPLAFGSAGAGA